MFSFHQNVIKALNARQQHELCEPELMSYSNYFFAARYCYVSFSEFILHSDIIDLYAVQDIRKL